MRGMAMTWAFAPLGALLLAIALSAPGYAADSAPPLSPQAGAQPPDPAPAVPVQPPAASGADSPQAAAPAPAAKAAPVVPERDVRIEQKRVGRRVSEVIVTPAGFTYQYTMIHLEGQEAGSILQPHPELSVPRFFRFDF
jgi:hypothetical protein